VVRRGDNHGVHVAAVHHLAVVRVALALVALGHLPAPLFPDVAYSDDAAQALFPADGVESPGQPLAPPADANKAELKAVIGGQSASGGQACGGGGGLLHERSAVHDSGSSAKSVNVNRPMYTKQAQRQP